MIDNMVSVKAQIGQPQSLQGKLRYWTHAGCCLGRCMQETASIVPMISLETVDTSVYTARHCRQSCKSIGVYL